MKTMDSLDFQGKKVLVRVGFDVPIENGQVTDDSRIRASVDTISEVLQKGAEKVTLVSHLGRPEGRDLALSNMPVAKRLGQLLGESDLREDGEKGFWLGEKIYFLENIRFDSREQSKDEQERESLAQELLVDQDIYINDAFSVCHRAEASLKETAELAPVAVAGRLVQKEVEALNQALKPEHPAICILGGKKVVDKLPVLESMNNIADRILIGGAACLPFLKIQGFDIKESAGSDEESVSLAQEVWPKISAKVVLPETDDLVWGDDQKGILDIGPETVKKFSELIKGAKTIIWNGPMGKFEDPKYAEGTNNLAKAIAESEAKSFVGGGESALALKNSGLEDRITYVSTGGGATLEYLSGVQLPGLIPLGVYSNN